MLDGKELLWLENNCKTILDKMFRGMSKKISYILIVVLTVLLASSVVFIIRLMNDRMITPVSEQLGHIEDVMLRRPEMLDSLMLSLDTIQASEHDIARLNLIKGYQHYKDLDIVGGMNLIEKADAYFYQEKDYYYVNFSGLIKAFSLEYLELYDESAGEYRKCDGYFKENNLPELRFYTQLGLLRLSTRLNLNKDIFINEINHLPIDITEPYYQGLIYSALAYVEEDQDEMIKLLDKVIYIFKEEGDERNLFINLMNRLSGLFKTANKDSVNNYYNYVLNQIDTTQLNAYQKIWLGHNYAGVLYKNGEYNKAIEQSKFLLNEARKQGVEKMEARCYAMLHLCYSKLGDYEKSLANYRQYYYLFNQRSANVQKARILALGANYRFEKLEQERLLLKSRFEKSVWLVLFIIVLFVLMVYWYQNHLKKSKLREVNLIKRNEVIGEQLNELLLSLEQQEEENSELIAQIKVAKQHYHDNKELREFLQTVNDDDSTMTWMDYEVRFNDHRPGWIHRLEKQAPGLTATDIRYCMCFYFNLSNAVTAKLCIVSIDAVKSAKKRVRDKLNLADSKEIYLYLKEIQ